MELPYDAFVSVTWRCNSHCVMCDAWKQPPGEEIKPEEFAKLPKSLKFINISGGEPTLRDDLPEIIEVIARGHKAKMCISTNGFLPDRIEKQMKQIVKIEAKVRVMISIDGIDARHDEVRGLRGAFDKAMNSVKILKQMGVEVGIAYLATNYNVDQLTDVMNLAKALKIDFTGSGVDNNAQITLSQNNLPIGNLSELKHQYEYLIRDQLKSFSTREWGRAYANSGTHYYAATRKRKIPCGAGTDFLFMAPNGDIYPDMVLDYKLGNIRSQPFEEIWRSQRAEDFRNSIKDIGYCSTPCWMLCTVSPWMRRHKLACAVWVIQNKLRAHLGLPIKPIQG